MGKKMKPLDRCHTDGDFVRWTNAQPHGRSENGGKHTKLIGPRGRTVVGNHGGNYELPTGTRHSLIKQLRAIFAIMSILVAIGAYVVIF